MLRDLFNHSKRGLDYDRRLATVRGVIQRHLGGVLRVLEIASKDELSDCKRRIAVLERQIDKVGRRT